MRVLDFNDRETHFGSDMQSGIDTTHSEAVVQCIVTFGLLSAFAAFRTIRSYTSLEVLCLRSAKSRDVAFQDR